MLHRALVISLIFTAFIYGQNPSMASDIMSGGVFNTPVGASKPGPLTPGKAYEFTFQATPGSKLSLAMMFGQSNDLFYAPEEAGIPLFDTKNKPVGGDVTSQILLWDAGTEVNQEPGVGPDQAPRQKAPNTGDPDSNNLVRVASDDFHNLPVTSKVLRVTLKPISATGFKVRIENISKGDLLKTSAGDQPVVISPGIWVVHTAPGPLFTTGQPDRGNGLEALAEEGNPAALAAIVTSKASRK